MQAKGREPLVWLRELELQLQKIVPCVRQSSSVSQAVLHQLWKQLQWCSCALQSTWTFQQWASLGKYCYYWEQTARAKRVSCWNSKWFQELRVKCGSLAFTPFFLPGIFMPNIWLMFLEPPFWPPLLRTWLSSSFSACQHAGFPLELLPRVALRGLWPARTPDKAVFLLSLISCIYKHQWMQVAQGFM